MKNESLLYTNTTVCCNFNGKAQYIKMMVNGPYQLVHLNGTSTQSSPQVKKALTSTHCTPAVICSPDAHNSGTRGSSMCDTNTQQSGKAQPTTHFSNCESHGSQSDCTANIKVWCRRDFPEDGNSMFLCHTITSLMTILLSKINDRGGKGQKRFLSLHTVLRGP
jgi:hypothetical protein